MAHRQRWISSLLSILIGGTALATGALPVAAGTSGPAAPSVRLYSARAHITAQHFKGQPSYIDPGTLLEAVGGAWQIDAGAPGLRPSDRCRTGDQDLDRLDLPAAAHGPGDLAQRHAEVHPRRDHRPRRPPGALPLVHLLPVGHGHARLAGRAHEPDLSARLLHRALFAGLRLGHRPGLGPVSAFGYQGITLKAGTAATT